MSNLAGEMKLAFYELVARDKSVLNDVEFLKDLYDVNSYFKQYSEKYLPLANKQEENQIENKYLEITLFIMNM